MMMVVDLARLKLTSLTVSCFELREPPTPTFKFLAPEGQH